MRVLDCDICGETLQAAEDAELTRRVVAHYRTEHDGIDEDEAGELVEAEAYEALDA